MHQLLTSRTNISRGGQLNMTTHRLVVQQRQSIDRLRRYYMNDYIAVNSTNPLLRLLYAISTSSSYLQTYNLARSKESELCAVAGIFNDINKGHILHNIFYKDTPCILVDASYYTATDFFKIDDWMDMQPCRVLVHPGIEYSLSRPDLSEAKGDYAIIGIDIPALGFMYGKWLEMNFQRPLTEQERPENFLAKFLFPNMLYSQFDAIALNVLDEALPNLSLANYQRTPMQVVDFTFEYLSSITQTLAIMQPSTTFKQALEMIPAMSVVSLSKFVAGLNTRITQVNRWIEIAMFTVAFYSLSNRFTLNPEKHAVALEYAQLRRTMRLENVISGIPSYQVRAIVKPLLDQLDIVYQVK